MLNGTLDKINLDDNLMQGQQKFNEFGKGYNGKNKVLMKKMKKILLYSYFLALGGLVYEFIQNRTLSSRVNELQGKVDNLYKQVNEMKNGNRAFERK